MSSTDDLPEMEGHVVGDKSRRQRFLLSSTAVTIPGTMALVAIPWFLGWPALDLASGDLAARAFSERLELAFTWCFVAFVPYALVCLTILQTRLTQGAHNPLAGAEDASLAIHCRVMQNTLEQLVWFVLCIVPVAWHLHPLHLHLVPLASMAFVLARLIYWRGYFRDGTLGRRYGVQMTFSLNISLFVLTAVLLITR